MPTADEVRDYARREAAGWPDPTPEEASRLRALFNPQLATTRAMKAGNAKPERYEGETRNARA